MLLVACVSAGATSAFGQAEPPPPGPVAGGCFRLVDFDTVGFRKWSQRVTHELLPLKPGTQRVFEGRSNATGEVLPHRVSFTVTRLTKVVDGVTRDHGEA